MKKLFIFVCCLAAFAPLWAGVAPKPEMDFTFIYSSQQNQPAVLPQTSEQIQCQDNQCLQSAPLGTYGLQKLYCQAHTCFSIAYEYAPYQQLVLDFSDGVKRTSNVFAAPEKLRSNFHVIVREKDLQVELAPTEPMSHDLLRADAWTSFIIIIMLELVAAWAYLYYTRKSYRILYSVLVANLITLPLSWRVLGPWMPQPWVIWLSCLVFETAFLWLCNRKRLTARDALNLSFAINVTSYSIEMILSFLLAPYLF